MVSKNNLYLKYEKNSNHQQHFGLRKLSVGVASVLLGTTFYLGSANVVHADTTVSNSISEQSMASSATAHNSFPSSIEGANSATDNVDSTTVSKESTYVAQSSATETANTPVGSSAVTTPSSDNNSSSASTTPVVTNQASSSQNQNVSAPAVSAETKTAVKVVGNSAINISVENAHQGDTYKMVLQTDSHDNGTYMAGTFGDNSTVSNKAYIDNSRNQVFEGTFLKDATINQPIQFNFNWNDSMINMPGTYSNPVSVYYNDKLIFNHNFDVVVPNQEAYASWDDSSYTKGIIHPKGVNNDLTYQESRQAYWLIGNDNTKYEYKLNVTPIQKALDHGDTTITIPISDAFNVDDVNGIVNWHNRDKNVYRMSHNLAKDDYDWLISNGNLIINLHHSLQDKYNFDSSVYENTVLTITGHYDENKNEHGIHVQGLGTATITSFDGQQTHTTSFAGISADLLGQNSLKKYSKGTIYSAKINAEYTQNNVEKNGQIYNHVWVIDANNSSNRQAGYVVNLRNASLFDVKDQSFTITLPDGFITSNINVWPDIKNAFSELTYHYADGSTSSALSNSYVTTYFDKDKSTRRSKVATSITGKFNLKNSLDQRHSYINLTVNGALDPNKAFTDGTILTATLVTNDSLHETSPSVITVTQDTRKVDDKGYISTNDPTNLYLRNNYVTNELNVDLGTISPGFSYSSKLDNITGSFEVTLPKNTSLDYISGGTTYWESPVIDKTVDGRVHLLFKLKDDSFKVSHADDNYANQAVPDKVNADRPVIHFKSTSLYVPSLQTDSGTAKLTFNGEVVNQATFSVSVLSAVAQYLITGIQGNNDISPSLNASSDDKKTGNINLQYNFVNGTEKSEIENAVFVGNVSDTRDGQSEFNMHLTGPLTVSDVISQKDLTKNVNITYSDKLIDIKNASTNDLSDYISADDVSNWSKIKSFKIAFSTPVMGGHVYQINAPAFVENQVDNVNKTGYLSSIMFGDGVAPFRITAGSSASAKLTIEGQSLIHQKLHYIDENGNKKYIDLPASEDIKLTDLADTFNYPSTLSDAGKRLIPTHYYWDGQLPTMMNSTDVYPDNLPNNLAQNGKLSYYDFDNDSIIWNLLSEPSEKATLTETIHYKYVDNKQQAAPDYVVNIPVTIYYDHLTNNIVSVVLPSNLEEVQSPYVDLFNAYYGHFNGYNAGEYSSNNLSEFTNIDLKNHHVTIDLTDYYAQSAARLYVVDPNTGLAKTVETTYNLDGSGNINFKTTDKSLRLDGYDMHVYYKQSRSLVNLGVSYDINGSRLNYPYKTQSGKWDDTTRTVFGSFQDFKGYDSLKDALDGYYDDENTSNDHVLNGKYDILTDMGVTTDSITGKPTFYPSQNFFVFYTPQQKVLKEQLMITADNDPWANSSDKALQLLAIPSSLSDAAKSELYSFIGDARSMLVYNGDGLSSRDRFTVNLNKDDYPNLFAELNKLGISLTPSTSFIGTGTFEMFGRPGYYVDKQSYQITGDDGVTRTYTVNLKPYDDFLKLSDADKVGKLIYKDAGNTPTKLLTVEYDNDGNLLFTDKTSYDYGNNFGNNSIHLSDFTKDDDAHMSLTMYASPEVLSQSNPYPLFDLPLFGMFGIFYDSTLHDENTPDPHPQIINVHYAKMPPVAQSNNNVQINIHYVDVTDLQRNANGQYEFGGGYDNTKKFVNGSVYDLTKVESYSDLTKFIQNNAQQIPQAMDYTINSDGSLTVKQLINQTLTSDLIKLQQNGELANKYQYNMTPFDDAISDDYVIVQSSPFATTGKHVIDPNDLDGYKSLSDPTGQNGHFNAMLSLNTQYGTSTQNYYVYLKRKQKINYQVKVEDANGQVLSTLTPSTLLGVGGSNELVSNAVDGKITIGQKYQNIIDSLEKQGYQLVNQSNGETIASDTLTDLYFDNDQTKDQLVTLYVTQNKQATVHYIDVNNSNKKNNYEPNDGVELANHVQTMAGLIGSAYTNILWDYASDGYELADTEIPAETTKGDFKFSDPSSRDYYVYLKHSYKNVSDAVTKYETIHYIYKNGKQAAPDYIAQTTFTRTGTQDLTNQNIAWNKWQPGESYTFKAIASPEIKDYQPDFLVVDTQTTTPDDEDIVKTVIYSFIPKHDTIPNDGYDKPTAKFSQETKTFTRTINYRGTKDFGKTYQAVNGSPDSKSNYVQTIKFTRDVLETVDKDGNVLPTKYGDWKADGSISTVKSANAKDLGYDTVDIENVNGVTVDPNSSQTTLDPVTVTYSIDKKHDTIPNDGYDKPTAKLSQETKTFTRTINYRGTKDFGKTYQAVNGAPDGKSSYVQTIKFTRDVLETIDKDGNILSTEYGDWKADGSISVVKSADAKNLGYDTIDIENVDGVTVDPNSSQTTLDPVTVTYSIDKKHDMIPNDGYDKPTAKLSQETKTFTRTINYRGTKDFGKTHQAVNGSPDGKSNYVQTIKFTRDVLETVDKDGNVLSTEYGDWKAKGSIDTVKSANAKDLGYDTVDIENVNGVTVDPNSSQTTLDPVTVTYSIDKKHDTIPNDGYDKPSAKLSQETKTFTRTINYRGTKDFGKTYQAVNGAPDGKSSYVQTIKFTRDVLETVDKDGNVLSTEYGDWKTYGSISAVKSADAKSLGYDTVDIENVDGITVDHNSSQTTLDPVTVTYSIDKKHDTVPNDGYDKPTINIKTEHKTYTRTIQYRGTKDGGKTYVSVNGSPDHTNSYIQTIEFTRHIMTSTDAKGNVTILETGPWVAENSTLAGVPSEKAEALGYDEVDVPLIDAYTINPETDDTDLGTIIVTYSINPTIDDTNDHQTPDTDEPQTPTTDTTDRQDNISVTNIPETPTTGTTDNQNNVSSVQTSSTIMPIANDESNNDVSIFKHKAENSNNSDTRKLPQTGSNSGTALTAIGIATTLSALLLLAGKKRKRE